MAAKLYLTLSGGKKVLKGATVSSTGASQGGDIVALDNTGKLDLSIMPVGMGPDTLTVVASEALAAGDWVNLWDDTGTVKARKADASVEKPAHGFVLAGVASAADALVYFEGTNTQLVGLTLGARYYLSATDPGGLTTVAPSATGNIVQYVGTAHAATSLNTELDEYVIIG